MWYIVGFTLTALVFLAIGALRRKATPPPHAGSDAPATLGLDEFWQLIEAHVQREDGMVVDVSALVDALAQRPRDQILAFDALFTQLDHAAYSWDLWGAAYVIGGGCSDDGFDYFRGWLLGMGRQAYANALTDPESLADIAVEEAECEELLSVAHTAYERATGESMPRGTRPPRPELGDDDWDFDDEDEMQRRYPRLWERFG